MRREAFRQSGQNVRLRTGHLQSRDFKRRHTTERWKVAGLWGSGWNTCRGAEGTKGLHSRHGTETADTEQASWSADAAGSVCHLCPSAFLPTTVLMCKSPNDTDDHLNAILNCVSLHILLVLLHKVGETLQGQALAPVYSQEEPSTRIRITPCSHTCVCPSQFLSQLCFWVRTTRPSGMHL